MLRKWMFRIALLACLILYFVHFTILQGYAVNVPFWDEWNALNPDQLPSGFSLKGLFAQHNEHRIVTTKLLTWSLYQLGEWNLVTHQTINFLIYGLLLFMIVRFARRTVPQLDVWIVLSFIPFLLSPINSENHFWGFQTQFHFSLLFFLAAIYFLYNEDQKWSDLLFGSAMAALAIYSLSSGLVSNLINLLIFSVFKVLRFRSVSDAKERQRELRQLMLVISLIGSALALWFVGYHGVNGHPPHAMPYTKTFWAYYINVLGLGFGVDTRAFLPNFLCLLINLTPVIWEIWRKKGRLSNSSWAIYAGIAGILAALAAITVGRANFGIEQSKSSRYSEIGMILIPLSVLAWSVLLQHNMKLRAYALSLLWLFCFFTFQNNWSSFSDYKSMARDRTKGILCVESYYAGRGDANCPTLFPTPIAQQLDEAKRLNISFYQNVQPYIGLVQNIQSAIGKETLYSVDIINGQLLPKELPVIIDAQAVTNITIGGWAVDAQTHGEAGGVFIVVDGRKDIPAVYGQDRPDVASAYQESRYRYSGFAASIPTSILEKGTHTLTLKILAGYSNGYYEPEQRINIEVR